MEGLSNLFVTLNNLVWSNPIIFLILGSAIYFTIRLEGVQVRNIGHQIHLLFSSGGSDTGISPFATFCTVIGYRVGTANVAGVAVAVWSGGPGAIFWMLITSILDTAISYAECALGQVYKIKQDGEYRGGAYYYIQRGLGFKPLALIYAAMTLICVPILTVAPHAFSITSGFKNSLGISQYITGAIAAVLLFIVISGGIRRIAKTAEMVVPFMTIGFVILTIIVLIIDAKELPAALSTIVTSAFGVDAVFGGMLGTAVLWGVKRSVNSSGAGMGEAVPAASATECRHPGVQGLVNSFSVYIDVFVCICTGLIIILTDCFNVKGVDGTILHLGQGSAIMAQQAAEDSAGIIWAQEALNTIFPGGIGATVLAFFLFFFAFTTLLNYYYQGETAIAYLLYNKTQNIRKRMIWVLRIAMPLVFFYFAVQKSSTSFASGELGVGLMVWFNVIILLLMSPTIVKVYRDYKEQRRSGVEPVFNPEKLGIKNADIWMEINADVISSQAESGEGKSGQG
ncbi:amino acid carrier protein [Clostridium sp. AM58-1XD]|uniref:alanine/glycine:cation symporter family protein n=1 Tax=Clostridium sp. AM58-1XD TaxID=2292307 RepID=UPI000E4B7D6F|nr:amino acid carrier protein [Clostridium sp. AM58-1XD]RGY99665.1 alanine:cation symporter family protein [Clostridium sp. AM58-1XD]